MIARFIQSLTRLVGEPNAHRYLLAVSGGADSIVMAYLCYQIGLNFEMVHCNFHLRGEDSNMDMRLVQAWASQRNIPLHIREFDTLALQEHSGMSVEMMARKLRYEWFDELGQSFDFIVTAHHANDAAETMLLNLSRGTGLKGLCAIPERNGKIIRPMLAFSATEIRSFADKQNIDFAIDSTNSDETIKRNKIRHSVIPLLTEINPNLINTLTHDCHVLRQQYAFYQRQMASKKSMLLTQKEDTVIVNYAALRNDPDKNIILFEILKDYGFTAAVADALCQDVQSGKQFLSQEFVLLAHGDELLIKSVSQESGSAIECFTMEELECHFNVERVHSDGKVQFERDNKILYLPQRLLTWPVTIRYWQKGDFFYPFGGKGKKKLSDYFIDHKIDCFAKQQIPLFCIGKDIVWIVGHRSDNRYRITDKDRDYYKITYQI